MNLAQLRSRTQLRAKDLDRRKYDEDYIDLLINEGLRRMAFETLLLQDKDSSLTYSSANDGFALPSDFIKVRFFEWSTSANYNVEIVEEPLDLVRKKRNQYVDSSSTTAIPPQMYAIQGGYIITDSTGQTSPTLYYYKYDSALSNDTDSPSFDSEYHNLLVEYAVWQLTGSNESERTWKEGLDGMNANPVGKVRARYVGL